MEGYYCTSVGVECWYGSCLCPCTFVCTYVHMCVPCVLVWELFVSLHICMYVRTCVCALCAGMGVVCVLACLYVCALCVYASMCTVKPL